MTFPHPILFEQMFFLFLPISNVPEKKNMGKHAVSQYKKIATHVYTNFYSISYPLISVAVYTAAA